MILQMMLSREYLIVSRSVNEVARNTYSSWDAMANNSVGSTPDSTPTETMVIPACFTSSATARVEEGRFDAPSVNTRRTREA